MTHNAATAVFPRDCRNMGASIIAIFIFAVAATSSLLAVHVYGVDDASTRNAQFSRKHLYQDHFQEMQGIKAAFLKRDSSSSPPRPTTEIRSLQQASPPPYSGRPGPIVYHVTAYGADPTGQNDSTDAILGAISDALNGPGKGFLMNSIVNLGGARVDLDGGNYLITRPLQFPVSGKGNLVVSSIILTLGWIAALAGNDNSVTDVVIFSAQTGIVLSGQANLLNGVHCYNKATGFGGIGIHLQLPGLTQTRIVNSYMDYTGIVAEDPVQLTISNSFFLGDAFILLKSIKGVINGVTIVDNMFAGSDKGVEIVQLDQRNGPFDRIDQVSIDKNNVRGMRLKTTVARASVEGHGTSWTADLKHVLVFPDLIKQVQYTFITDAASFPLHFLRNVSDNKVVIQSDAAVPARIYITADQGWTY